MTFIEMKVRIGHLNNSWLNEYKTHQFAESDLFYVVLNGLYENMHSQYRYTVTADSYLYIHATFPASCAANKSSEFVIHVQGKNQKYSVNWWFVEQYYILNRSRLHSFTVSFLIKIINICLDHASSLMEKLSPLQSKV